MEKKKEKAFPRSTQTHHSDVHNITHHYGDEGMDLRDYFAAKVIEGLAASNGKFLRSNAELYAETAYKVADAMMKQREC